MRFGKPEKGEGRMELVIAYLRQRRGVMLAAAGFCAVFALSFALYHLPLAAVGYPAALCALLGLGLLAWDFARVRARHRQLCRARQLTAATLTGLPPAQSIEQADYQQLVAALQAETAALQTDMDARYRDMIDYYTVWAHQIKTPIAAMRLTLQNEDSTLSRRLSGELFRVEQYVQMVLAYLRLDSVSGDYVFRRYRLDDIVRQSVRRFSAEFISRRLSLRYEPAELTLITDEKWLGFVIEQLLSNALKYTRTGGLRIYLQPPKTLCIEDSGIGIAPEDLPRVFERGYTGINGRVDPGASGLGLYLCRRICKNLGAEISLTSQLGKGTTVRIALEQYPLRPE